MLKLHDIHVYYGHVHALKGISLEIPQGKIISLLGANGAGKSTTLKMISRLIPPKQGSYDLESESMLKKNAQRSREARGDTLSGKPKAVPAADR